MGNGKSIKRQTVAVRGMQAEFISLVFVLVVSSASGSFAQQPHGKCSQVKYPERISGTHLYRLKIIEGQAAYGAVAERGELNGASGLCVVLFSRRDKRLVAGIPTDSSGHFRFAEIPAGKYVLVVSVSELHDIVVPVEVAGNIGARSFKRWGLMLHLRSKEDPSKSFVTPITQLALRDELLKMERDDQAVRTEMIQHGSDRPDNSIEMRMSQIDEANTARLKAIIKRYGWPGPDRVGADGAYAAFMLLQHSPDLPLQQAMLPVMRRRFEIGHLSAWNYALLVDRVLVRTGKRQIYGMSLERWNGKEPVLSPIEDEANVDKRRAKIGLPPLREYLELMKGMYFPQQ